MYIFIFVNEGERGAKRILYERVDSPSKKQRTFDNLFKFWGGPGGLVCKKKHPNEPRIVSKSLKTTTKPAQTDTSINNMLDLEINSDDLNESECLKAFNY